jgi:hypothetical protein
MGEAKAKTISQLNLLTVEQCADLLQCSVSMIERFIKGGRLSRVSLTSREVDPRRPGRKNWRVRPEALEAFIQSLDGMEPQDVSAETIPRPVLPMATGTDGRTRAKLPRNSR